MVAELFITCVRKSKVFILKKCTLILLLGDGEVDLPCRSVLSSLKLLNPFAKLIQDVNWMGD